MRYRTRTRDVPIGLGPPFLLLLLTVLTGAWSPFGAPAAAGPAGFPSVQQRAALASRSGYLGTVAGALSPAQLIRAVVRRDRLPAGERTRLDRLLAGASTAARGYLAEGFAAGHTVDELAAFGAAIAGHRATWLKSHLRPVDPSESGVVEFRGDSISQYNDTTCGSTVIVAARAIIDPLYALQLTTSHDFLQRLQTEEQRVHDETDTLWPQVAGTPPWGVSKQLGRDLANLGTGYHWVAVPPGLPGRADQVLRQALIAVDHGYPVPILIGNLLPRHYVLLVRHDASGAYFYEPTAGDILLVSPDDLQRRDLSELGYADLRGAILPSGPIAASDPPGRG